MLQEIVIYWCVNVQDLDAEVFLSFIHCEFFTFSHLDRLHRTTENISSLSNIAWMQYDSKCIHVKQQCVCSSQMLDELCLKCRPHSKSIHLSFLRLNSSLIASVIHFRHFFFLWFLIDLPSFCGCLTISFFCQFLMMILFHADDAKTCRQTQPVGHKPRITAVLHLILVSSLVNMSAFPFGANSTLGVCFSNIFTMEDLLLFFAWEWGIQILLDRGWVLCFVFSIAYGIQSRGISRYKCFFSLIFPVLVMK